MQSGTTEKAGECSMAVRFQPGDVVVYRKQKSSVHPGPHARDIQPAVHGDSYSYAVDKFWRVIDVRPDNMLVVRTRKGKQHMIPVSDPNLRRAHWWERLLFWHRFPPRATGE
jgi:hypothetical protein